MESVRTRKLVRYEECEEGRYIAALLSTVLEKVVMVLVVVGTGCSYTSERHTRQRHFLYMVSVFLSLSLPVSLSFSYVALLSCPFSPRTYPKRK